MNRTVERFPVNRAGSHAICERVEQFLGEQGLNEREAARARLTTETLLRRIAERGGQTTAELTLWRQMGRACVRLTYPGAAFDPTLPGRESPADAWSAQLLTDLGLIPEWSWQRGQNCLLLRPRRHEWSAWLFHAGALALAALCALLLPAGWALKLERFVFAPLCDLFCGVLGIFAPFAVLLSLLSVFCGAGDTALAGGAGKRAVWRFTGLTCAWAAFGTALAALLLPGRLALFDGDAAARLGAVLRGAFERDASGASGSVVFAGLLAAAVGAALLCLVGRAQRVRECADQGAVLLRTILEALCRLSPLLIFSAAGRLFLRAPAELLRGLWLPPVLFAGIGLFAVAVKIVLAWLLRHLPLGELLKRLLPSALTALFSANPAASFGSAMDNCENRLGLPHPLVLLSLPVGSVLCAPVSALCPCIAALYVAASCGVVLDLPALLGMTLAGVLLAFAMPRVPGAYLVGFPLLLGQLGLPAEGLAVAAVLSILFDGLSAAFSVLYLQLEILMQSELGKRK